MNLTQTFIEAFIMFFVVVSPLKLIPLFLVTTAHEKPAQRGKTALRAIVIAAIIASAFALFGNGLLVALHIQIYSFRIAGGLLLLIMGFEMVFEKNHSGKADERPAADRNHDIAIFPLAIPFITGPATLTSIVLLTDPQAYTWPQQTVTIIALFSVLLLTYLCFLSAGKLLRWMGEGCMNVMGRVLGIILVALSVEMMLDGVYEAFGLSHLVH
jgi:multiple antibiotic resistance protein